MARRDYAGNAIPTVLASLIDGSALTMTIDSASGWPEGGVDGKFFVTIDRGLATEERILMQNRVGTTLNIATLSDRGVDGTVIHGHEAGASVEHTFSAVDADEANQHVNDDSIHMSDAEHDTEARHTFGAALGTPVTPLSVGTVASTGSGDNPAREDHRHVLAVSSINHPSLFAAGVVDSAALATNSVGLAEIQDNAVNGAKIATGSVGVTEIADSAVTIDKIATDAVDTAEIIDLAVTSAKLADNAVTAPKFDAASAIPHSSVTRATGAAGTTTSPTNISTPVNLDIVNFVKYRADTKLIVSVSGCMWIADALEAATIAVDIGGTDTDITSVSTFGPNVTAHFHGLAPITLPAGTIPLIRVQWRYSGAGNITQVGLWMIRAEETF
jgi:hypothetical protein